MTDNKNTESTRIETLIPQQLINDSAALVEFLKEYYKFLSQSGQPTNVIENIVENKDLDTAIEKYISLVEKEIGYGMVSRMEANKTNVYKNIEEFYDAKGSLDSFKLLFRLLYNTEIEVSLPKEQILIASDGRWEQQNVVYAQTISGNIFSIVNTQIDIVNTNGTIVQVEVERVRFVRDSVYEITINQNFVGNILDDATITTTEYSGQLINALGSFRIIQPGRNFSIGQILEIDDGSIDGLKSLIKITSVDSNGAILNFEFIQFGTEYQSDFTSYLTPTFFNSDFEQNPADFGFPNVDRFGRVFESLSTNEYISIEINPYSLNYFASDYTEGSRHVGDYDSVYNQDSESETIDQEVIDPSADIDTTQTNRAIIEFRNTPISKYSGAFTTNNGFLSDDIYLQDNNYYQVYSYVIKSDQRFTDYENIIRKTIHPAGMAMFGQFQITNEIDASAAITAMVKFFSERLIDSVDTIENIAKLIIKPVDDEIITESFLNWELTKPLENNIVIEDLPLKEVQKGFSDTQPILEQITDITLGKNFVDEANPNDGGVSADENLVYALDYFSQDYCEGLTFEESTHTIELTKSIVDTAGIYDSGTIATTPDAYALDYFAEVYSEGIIVSGPKIEFRKNISDSVEVQSIPELISNTKGGFSAIADTSDEINQFNISKNIDSNINISDAIQISKNKALEDSINISEFGTLDMNDYSLNYFSEPYVEKIYNF
jgi:hypothetical protein